jgi:limonene 1,2-monooxygenase
MAHNWANWGATKHSYELMARYVFPHFQNLNDNRHASMSWVKDNKEEFTTQVRGAVGARIVQHMMEKGSENIRPEIVALITGAAPPKAD